MDEDISRLKTAVVGLLNDLGCNGSTVTEDLINEMCRFGASELHAVAAFIGGIASQEVIKVLYISIPSTQCAFIFPNIMSHLSFFWSKLCFKNTSMISQILIFFTAHNKTICSHGGNFHIQRHWSEVSTIGTVECFEGTGKLLPFPLAQQSKFLLRLVLTPLGF